VYLPIPHVLPFVYDVAANAAPLTAVEIGTPSEYDFLVKAVTFTGSTPGTLIQVQWPDGRYLSNPGIDFFSFVGTGKRARLVDPHKLCARQSKIRFNIDNSEVDQDATLEIMFEGVLLVGLVKNGK
jgi:hypothetical protein